MKRSVFVVLAIAIIISLISVGCGGTKYTGEVNVYNWGEYIDESIFDKFEKETGIKVNYSTFTNNEALYSVLKTSGASYDVIIPSDYMVSRLIDEGMLEKIDYSNIPNYNLIGDNYKNLEYDPTGEYSVAYMWGTVGLIYNKTMVNEEITSWSALFDAKYAGEILMFDNSRDAMGIALKYLGYSQNTTSENELDAAYTLLEQQKPLVQAYVMDQIFDKMESGEAAIAPYYAGDFISMSYDNDDLAFVIPKEGSNYFVDAMCIPKGAKNKENAEKFINYMCSTNVALANMETTGYASANTEALQQYLDSIDEKYSSIMNPTASLLSKCDVFINLPQETLTKYDELWTKLKSK